MRHLWLVSIAACQAPVEPHHPLALAGQPGDLAIVDTNVVDVIEGRTLPHRTVIVRGDRIAAIESSDVALADSIKTIDGRGKYLLPGLSDMHVHLSQPHQLAMLLAAGVTVVRNMAGEPGHLEWRDEIAAGLRIGPTIVTAGPVLDGAPPVYPTNHVIATSVAAEQSVIETRRAGYDFVKVYDHLDVETYDAIIAAAAREHIAVAGHAPAGVPLQHVLDSGQRSIEHLTGYPRMVIRTDKPFPEQAEARARALLASLDDAKLAAWAIATAKSGVWNCPTLVVAEQEGRMDDHERLARETLWVEQVPQVAREFWRSRLPGAGTHEAVRIEYLIRVRIVKALAAAGAKLLVGTDTGNPYVVAGSSVHLEIEALVAAGVPRARVLRAATAGAADFLGTEAGRLAPGKIADLVLATSDPLAGAISIPPAGVMSHGSWRSHNELEALLHAD